jgi:hypothetical protein
MAAVQSEHKKIHIILVHGVGNPALGSLLSPAEKVLGGTFTRDDFYIDGIQYPHAMGSSRATLSEVNWSDLRRPLAGLKGVLQHIIWLISSMLTVPRSLYPPSLGRKVLAGYEFGFQAVIVWVLSLPIIGMYLYAARPGIGYAIAAAGGLVLAMMAWFLGRYWSLYKAGFIWAVVTSALGAWAILNGKLEFLAFVTARIYVGGQIALGILLFLAGSALMTRRDLTLFQRLGHMGLLYLPFALLSGVGALIWSLSLFGAKYAPQVFDAHKFEKWGNVFTLALHYNLDYVELVFTQLIGAIGILALLLVLLYVIVRKGRVAQDGLAVLLILMPVLIGIAGFVFFTSLITFHPASPSVGSSEVFRIYLRSAARLLPFLPFTFGPLGIVLDVLGDVVFFLAPGKISIRDDSERRVEGALNYVSSKGKNDDTVVIFCHSQGSVIVRDVLGRFALTPRLYTVGSPLDSIYERFLGWRPQDFRGQGIDWLNLFRTGDYVGGPIEGAKNQEIGPGGHTGYWCDPKAWTPVLDLLNQIRTADSVRSSQT